MNRHPSKPHKRRHHHWSQQRISAGDLSERVAELQEKHINKQKRRDALILCLLGSSNPAEKNSYQVYIKLKPPRKPPEVLGFRRGPKAWWRYADGILHATSIKEALALHGYQGAWYKKVSLLRKTAEAVAESEGLQRLRRREFAEYREAMVVAPRVEGAALPEPRNGVPVEVKPGLSASPSRRIFSARRSL